MEQLISTSNGINSNACKISIDLTRFLGVLELKLISYTNPYGFPFIKTATPGADINGEAPIFI